MSCQIQYPILDHIASENMGQEAQHSSINSMNHNNFCLLKNSPYTLRQNEHLLLKNIVFHDYYTIPQLLKRQRTYCLMQGYIIKPNQPTTFLISRKYCFQWPEIVYDPMAKDINHEDRVS